MSATGTYVFRTRVTGDGFPYNDTVVPNTTIAAEGFRTLPLYTGFTAYSGIGSFIAH